MADGGDGDGVADACATGDAARLRMLMPFLVKLTDSQIKMLNAMVPKAFDGFDDLVRVVEQIGSIRLAIDLQPTGSDLHV